MNWKTDYIEPNLNYGAYWSVKLKGDLIVVVGDEYSQAVILMGKK